jgi:S-DNA-T family DNA segregation ATPase FtsK/SpoIIIE
LLNFGPISAYEIAVRSREEQGGLPDFSRLLDALHMQSVDPYTVISSWQAGGSTSAVIGEAKAGPFRIYLGRYEAHMLIGGALGSGKSELLQTIVASLAATNRPDSVTFLLMDDEGGSTFQDCARLPHTVGVITDLAEHQADRVMQSLSAELARREYAKSAGRLTQLPKLLILVDEFAAMGNSASEFIVGLIDIYRRGRSLGIHLVLASRYSLDLIPAEIRANAGLRIAMRAESKSDSVEVIQADNAAYIAADTPGRAYVRAGSDLPTPIQVSRISGCRPDSGLDDSVSDLQVLIEAINEASDHLGILPQHRPWLPPLPKTLVLGELREDGELPASYELGQLRPVCYGLSDYPKDQAQRAAVIDFATFGHMMAVGTAGSGKSQLLRTIAASIAAEHSCADVHIYVLDGGNGRLAQVAELPHCGAVVTPAQTERTTRLIGRLSQEIGLRQELLARGGFETIGDQRAAASPDQRLPHIFLFLDSWDLPASLFRQMDEDAFASTVNEFLAYGANLGMHLIVTGNQAPVTKRVARMIKDKLIFRLEDGADYGRVGLRSARPVSYLTAGRAFHAASGVETQVALLNGEPGEAGQVAALRALASMVQQRDASVGLSRRPFQVDVLALVGDRFHVGDARGRPIGREDILAWLRDRHLSGASVALLGPRRAGKTWVLAELKRRLVDDGYTRVNHVVVPQPNSSVDTPDALASVIEREVRPAASPAETLLDEAKSRAGVGGDRLVYLLDEVGRLVDYAPAAVSWLRDLGQAGAWLVYTGTEKDWHKVVRWTLRAPGSSFGNDVNARPVGPISNHAALTFLTGTAANLRVNLAESTATEIVELIGSWPFYLQVVGDAVVREVQADDLQPLTDRQALTRLIQRRLLDEWTHHFQGRWEEIGRPGRAALLTRPGAAPESLSPAQRDDLRDVGLLRPGDEWLNDPPFFNWIARNVASLQDGEHQR